MTDKAGKIDKKEDRVGYKINNRSFGSQKTGSIKQIKVNKRQDEMQYKINNLCKRRQYTGSNSL